jgi:bifunctional DNA-binding transcriptional regulator/antitoxin component of YhaV-PrlF toxin-antitoxin module
MATLTLTSKQQATFPKETCQSLGIKPGDTIKIESRIVAGEKIWILRPQPARSRSWVGCLDARAKQVEDHSIDAIRASIAAGRKSRS